MVECRECRDPVDGFRVETWKLGNLEIWVALDHDRSEHHTL